MVTEVAPVVGLPDTLLAKGWVDRVGFARVDGRLCVAFPKVYDTWRSRLLNEAGLRTRHIVLLVRVLAKYVRSVGTQAAVSSGMVVEPDAGVLDWLEAACELYDEYQDNGLYWVKRENLSSRSTSGAIAWGATFARKPAHIIDGAPLHLDLVRRTRARSTNDLLHRLHATVLDEVAKLITGRSPIAEHPGISPIEIAAIRAAPKPALMKLARTTYSDRGKRLIGLIQRYLQLSGGGEARFSNSALLCSSDAFELVWEHMLRVSIENGGSALVGVPGGTWRHGEESVIKGILPRPDFGFVAAGAHGTELAIFDAKDKRIAASGRSGSEQDHYKQVIYRLLGTYDAPVWNALLFPSLQRGGPDEPFTVLGSHVWVNQPMTLVHEIAADYPTVCMAFLAGRRLNPTSVLAKLPRA
jgi:hypothetical protein